MTLTDKLRTEIERLRTEQAALIDANRTLLDCGIGSQTGEIRTRLGEIADEAHHLAHLLHSAGAWGEAQEAVYGWATTAPATRQRREVIP